MTLTSHAEDVEALPAIASRPGCALDRTKLLPCWGRGFGEGGTIWPPDKVPAAINSPGARRGLSRTVRKRENDTIGTRSGESCPAARCLIYLFFSSAPSRTHRAGPVRRTDRIRRSDEGNGPRETRQMGREPHHARLSTDPVLKAASRIARSDQGGSVRWQLACPRCRFS